MLLFESVACRNLCSIGDQFIEISLNVPTTLIVGANGCGKTSLILDSLCFGLFNRSFRGCNIPQITNSINGRECVVVVKFSFNGKKYVVKRGISPRIFSIEENGVTLSEDSMK